MITPVNDNVLVRPKKFEKTPNGLIMPDVNDSRPGEGEVIGVGVGRYLENGTLIAPPVKVGDSVFFKKYSPNEVEVNGEKLFVITSHDIIGIIS